MKRIKRMLRLHALATEYMMFQLSEIKNLGKDCWGGYWGAGAHPGQSRLSIFPWGWLGGDLGWALQRQGRNSSNSNRGGCACHHSMREKESQCCRSKSVTFDCRTSQISNTWPEHHCRQSWCSGINRYPCIISKQKHIHRC